METDVYWIITWSDPNFRSADSIRCFTYEKMMSEYSRLVEEGNKCIVHRHTSTRILTNMTPEELEDD